MAITRQGRPTHLVSQNKRIRFWHRCLTYVSNAWVIRVSKLIDGIDLDTKNKKYNPAKVFIKLDESDVSDLLDSKELPDMYKILVCQTRARDRLDKLCKPCIGSKST